MSQEPTIEVIGGVRNFGPLTNELQKSDPTSYNYLKIMAWYMMVKQRSMPVKWYKPTSKGTRVKFEMIKTVEQAKAELQAIIDFSRETREAMIESGQVENISQ